MKVIGVLLIVCLGVISTHAAGLSCQAKANLAQRCYDNLDKARQKESAADDAKLAQTQAANKANLESCLQSVGCKGSAKSESEDIALKTVEQCVQQHRKIIEDETNACVKAAGDPTFRFKFPLNLKRKEKADTSINIRSAVQRCEDEKKDDTLGIKIYECYQNKNGNQRAKRQLGISPSEIASALGGGNSNFELLKNILTNPADLKDTLELGKKFDSLCNKKTKCQGKLPQNCADTVCKCFEDARNSAKFNAEVKLCVDSKNVAIPDLESLLAEYTRAGPSYCRAPEQNEICASANLSDLAAGDKTGASVFGGSSKGGSLISSLKGALSGSRGGAFGQFFGQAGRR